jgi:hypothetical protein
VIKNREELDGRSIYHLWELKSVYKDLVEKPDGRRPLAIHRNIWEDII